MSIESYYTTKVTLRSVAVVEDLGNAAESFTDSDLMARMEPIRGSLPWMAQRRTPFEAWRMYCALDTAVKFGDKVAHDGSDMEVVSIARYDAHMAVDLARAL